MYFAKVLKQILGMMESGETIVKTLRRCSYIMKLNSLQSMQINLIFTDLEESKTKKSMRKEKDLGREKKDMI